MSAFPGGIWPICIFDLKFRTLERVRGLWEDSVNLRKLAPFEGISSLIIAYRDSAVRRVIRVNFSS